MSLTPRQRVLCALSHEEPDRVPLFIGTSGATTVLGPGYERLRDYLGIAGGPARWLSRPLQYTWMDEEVLVRLGSDGRPVAPGPAGSALRRDVSDDWLIDDWGVDLLNPVQVSAGEMGDTARLKREFGDRLSFCGAIDTQRVLPHGTPDDVRKEVRRRIKDMAPGGGYVAAAVHCLQPDVPPENVVAMCDEVARAGHYPLRITDTLEASSK